MIKINAFVRMTLFPIHPTDYADSCFLSYWRRKPQEVGQQMSTAKDLFLKKFKYSCCTILLVFQVYFIMIWHLHTLWSVHHDKSSSHLSPCKVITVILTTLLMLYIISVYLCDLYYITGCVDLLIFFSCFLSPSQSPLCWATTHFSLFLFCFILSFWFHI